MDTDPSLYEPDDTDSESEWNTRDEEWDHDAAHMDDGMDHKTPQPGEQSPTPELPILSSLPPTSSPSPPPPSIDDEVPHEIIIPNFRSLPNEYHPPHFTKWGYRWRLNVFPRGFNDSPNAMGLFLLMDAPATVRTPHMCFSLITVHPTDTTKNHICSSHHYFVGGVDCGYRSYLSLHELDRFLYDGTLKLQIHILKGMEPEKRIIPVGYNSRRETGLVGLKNQGATCYMNSLLQTLFLIPRFRHAVYSLPLDEVKNGESKKPSLTLALQRVFYQLQYDDESVTTKFLTQSFGWNTMESFMQHDVQEFARVLMDSVDEKMKGTAVQGMIAQLFEGRSQMFIECVNVDFKSSRTETFLDLQLNVKGFPDLISSFKNYVEIEELKEGNQYRAEGHGLQDARKGTRFLSFPPVLQLQLKRFAYDPATDAMNKIHDRFEFPERLDLTEFLPESERYPDDPAIYHLHSVLVHSGSAHGGHYTCYIRPIPCTTEYQHAPWFKFDDDVVTKATAEEAIAGNFGGNLVARGRTGLTIELQQVRTSNAYMLVYLRQNETKVREFQGFGDVNMKQASDSEMKEMEIKDDTNTKPHNFVVVPIPKELQQRMEDEKCIAEEAIKQERERHLYTTLKVYSEPQVIGQSCDFDLQYKRIVDGVESERSHQMQVSARILKNGTIGDAATTWEQLTGIPSERQQIWQLVQREDKTHRPNTRIKPTDIVYMCGPDIYIRDTINDSHPCTLSASSNLVHDSLTQRGDRVLLLLKYFDIPTQKCIFIGSTIAWKHMNMNQVKRYVRMRLEKLGYIRKEKYEHEEKKEKEGDGLKQDGTKQDGDEKQSDMSIKQEHSDTTMTDTVKSLSQGLSITDGEGEKGEENDVDIADVEEEQDPLDVWEETNIKMEPLSSCAGDSILSSLQPHNGDLYVFQRHYSSQQLTEMKLHWETQHKPANDTSHTTPFFITAAEYLDSLAHSMRLELRPFPHATDPYHIKANPQTISLHLRCNMPYRELFTHLETVLGQDLDRVTLTLSSDPGSAPLTLLTPIYCDIPISEFFRHHIIYYQFHTMTRTQRKKMIHFNVQYYGWKPTKPIHEFEVYVARDGIVADLEHAIREKLSELDNEHTGKRKEHQPNNRETTQEQNDGKRQKLESEHATTQHAEPEPESEPGAMESEKTETEASAIPSTDVSATDSATASASVSPLSPLTPSPFSPSGHLVLGVLRKSMIRFFPTQSIESASNDCSDYHFYHQRDPVQAMEMTMEEYQWYQEYETARQQGQSCTLTSQLIWFYPCIHPCGDGVETGFRLVITNDMTILDVRNKVAQRLRDQKSERWKIVKLENKSYMQHTWKDDVPFLQQIHPDNDRIGVINTEERVIPKKPSWAPRAAAVKIHQ